MSANHSHNDTQGTVNPEVEKQIIALTNYCLQQMMGGIDHETIKKDLVGRGVSPQLADSFIEQASGVLVKRLADWHSSVTNQPPAPPVQPDNPKKEAAKLQMLIGGLALGLGGLITLVSYGMSESGGKYILAYGAIIVGGWNVISGFWKYGNS